MKTNKFLKHTIASLVLASTTIFVSCDSDDSSIPTAGTKFTVSADIDDESYFFGTDDLSSANTLSIVGNGYEGWGGLSVSLDGYLYVLNNTDGLIERFEITEGGYDKIDAISSAALTPGAFFRYIQATDNGDLFLSSNPNDAGYTPYAIIDIETFAATASGFVNFPTVDERVNTWASAVVDNGKIYFGSTYKHTDEALTPELAESLITIVYDYPSLTNPIVLQSDASAGTTAGYRTKGSFATETGDIYQYNMTSERWVGSDEIADKPAVLVKITDGAYDDDYVINLTAHFGEPVGIWNVWYAEDGIAYANVVKEADVPTWGDLYQNTGTIVEINLIDETITELNLPAATFVSIFSLDCIVDGKFYIPVNPAGGADANIYEITIGGGTEGVTKGADLDGGNVFVNALLNN